jgi:hypothetical protein
MVLRIGCCRLVVTVITIRPSSLAPGEAARSSAPAAPPTTLLCVPVSSVCLIFFAVPEGPHPPTG